MRLPRVRYSLATLLIAMTAIAIALWGIPEWHEYQDRMSLERPVSQLKAGSDIELHAALPQSAQDNLFTISRWFDAAENNVQIVMLRYQRYWYCIYFVNPPEQGANRPPASSESWSEIRVFRLPPAPRDYAAQTVWAKLQVRNAEKFGEPIPDSRQQYLDDFLLIITGREKSDLNIKFELIHSDPPLADK